ncbi:MAG: lipocalin-like domain-containing protein [Prevotella sp.]|nr:lipocalin-like domain-containing protein [Prevotella sp.]
MKRSILYVSISILSIWQFFSLTSCEIETHAKGNIDGNWHLEQIDTLETGGSKDIRENRIFWGIQANLVQLRSYYDPENIYILRFSKTDKTFQLYEPRLNDREKHDPAVTDVTLLNPYGINELQESFQIEKLSGSKMILKSAKLRLHFETF